MVCIDFSAVDGTISANLLMVAIICVVVLCLVNRKTR